MKPNACCLAGLVLSLAILACICQQRAEAQTADKKIASAKSPIAFKTIDGTENGSQQFLGRREAELMEQKGGKLSGHDWWLWGLTGIDYDPMAMAIRTSSSPFLVPPDMVPCQDRLRFKRDSRGVRLLVEQPRKFPTGKHDDGPAALEMAIRLGD